MVGLAAEESAYLIQTSRAINDFSHPDIAALRVLLEYLSALEVSNLLFLRFLEWRRKE